MSPASREGEAGEGVTEEDGSEARDGVPAPTTVRMPADSAEAATGSESASSRGAATDRPGDDRTSGPRSSRRRSTSLWPSSTACCCASRRRSSSERAENAETLARQAGVAVLPARAAARRRPLPLEGPRTMAAAIRAAAAMPDLPSAGGRAGAARRGDGQPCSRGRRRRQR